MLSTQSIAPNLRDLRLKIPSSNDQLPDPSKCAGGRAAEVIVERFEIDGIQCQWISVKLHRLLHTAACSNVPFVGGRRSGFEEFLCGLVYLAEVLLPELQGDLVEAKHHQATLSDS
jgi:hypothetical protein